MSDKSVFEVKEGENAFFVEATSDEKTKTVSLTILIEDKAIECTIDKEDLDNAAAKLRLDEETIWSWTREAFFNGSKDHSFSMEGSSFVWRRSGGKKMKIKVGSFETTETAFVPAQRRVLSALVERNAALRRDNSEVTARHNKLIDDLKESRTKMAEMVKAKEEAETQLYERFLPVLQAKQDKIVELRDMLAAGPSKKRSQEDDKDSYGSGTDVDEEETPSKKMKPMNESSSLDDSQNFLNTKF